MADKFRVSQEHKGKTLVYGNFPAASAEEAVLKAYNKQKEFLPFDKNRTFHVKHGSVEQDVVFNG
jgi:hypothetical protein